MGWTKRGGGGRRVAFGLALVLMLAAVIASCRSRPREEVRSSISSATAPAQRRLPLVIDGRPRYWPGIVDDGPPSVADRALLSPTRVTVDVTDVPAFDALRLIGEQAGYAHGFWEGPEHVVRFHRKQLGAPVTVKVVDQPLWAAVNAVGDGRYVVGFGPGGVMGASVGSYLSVQTKWTTSGPFLVLLQYPVLWRSAAGRPEYLGITFYLREEGKVRLMGVAEPWTPVEARDDRGRALELREGESAPSWPRRYRMWQSGTTAQFKPPAEGVKSITLVKGTVQALVSLAERTIEIPVVPEAQARPVVLKDCRLLVHGLERGPHPNWTPGSTGWVLRFTILRDGRSDDEWRSIRRTREMVWIDVLDDQGRIVPQQGVAEDPGPEEGDYTWRFWMPDEGPTPRPGMPGLPAKVRVRFVERAREVDLPVEFRDVPIDPRVPPFN
jgi:hypothetical protein